MKQLKVDYPEYAREAQEKIDTAIEAERLEEEAPPSPEAQALAALKKRDHNICFNFPVARERPINDGIQYLRGIAGGLTVRAGPRACDRISCSSNAGIFRHLHLQRCELSVFEICGRRIIVDNDI
ncbi:hypothetical protein SNK04_007589 [Fusarium graminearum]